MTGSIPAHAGEPAASPAFRASSRVYPRTCGGTRSGAVARSCFLGLSPHMRGNRSCWPTTCRTRGSIPAHAGEPDQTWQRRHSPRVYPRTCGGTWALTAEGEPPEGLSPHMRGNRQQGRTAGIQVRSIPAHAGEPINVNLVEAEAQVYPRTCGGTLRLLRRDQRRRGLSPHMRGNRLRSARGSDAARSIPAHAGEPPVAPSPATP